MDLQLMFSSAVFLVKTNQLNGLDAKCQNMRILTKMTFDVRMNNELAILSHPSYTILTVPMP